MAVQLDFSNEPERTGLLQVNSKTPYNAEPSADALVEQFHTPAELFYIRNHAPVPRVDASTHRLSVVGVEKELVLSVAELEERFEKGSVEAALLCAGNRRRELNQLRAIRGVAWDHGAVSNAEWSGVWLRDVLAASGVKPTADLHVEFIGLDDDGKHGHFGASIPLDRALSQSAQVLLATTMNGEALTADHGFPLRVIVPGVIGARSVKWLSQVRLRSSPSDNHYMQHDYKILPQHVHVLDTAEHWWPLTPPVMHFNVQSVVAKPHCGERIARGAPYTVCGYAIAGGGVAVQRVDVSVDGGSTWSVAQLERKGRFSWTLWKLEVERMPSPCVVVCRAFDDACNTQPESADRIWNMRGIMNNAWHRIEVVDAKWSAIASAVLFIAPCLVTALVASNRLL